MAKSKPIKQIQRTTPREKVKPETTSTFFQIPLLKSKWLPYVILILLSLLIYIIRSKFIDLPLERDEGDYTYIGRLLLEGKVPYKDFYEQKPPGLFYSYACIEALFGRTVAGIKMGFILINILTCWLMYYLGSEIMGRFAGIATAVAFAFISTNPHIMGMAMQSEHIMALYVAAGAWMLARGLFRKNSINFLLSGVFFMLSATIKQNGIAFIGFGGFMITLTLLVRKWNIQGITWKALLFYILGVILPFLCILIVAKAGGWWDEMIFWIYTYPKESYVSKLTFERGIGLFEGTLKRFNLYHYVFTVLCVLGLIATWLQKFQPVWKIWITLFFVTGWVAIAPGWRFYGHYWIYWVPAVSLCVGVFFYFLRNMPWGPLKNKGLILSTIFLCIIIIVHFSNNSNYYLTPELKKLSREVYGTNPFIEAQGVSEYISQHAKPGDKLVVFGSEPEIFTYTGLECPTRHFYTSFVLGGNKRDTEWQNEMRKEISEAKPRWIVYVKHPISWFVQPNTDQSIIQWAWDYAHDNYLLKGMADQLSGEAVHYAFDGEAGSYIPQGQYGMYIFERDAP